MSVDIDWSSLVFDHQWMARLERLAFKRFGQSAIADEAVNYVLEHLS